jgi:hypothetical protein
MNRANYTNYIEEKLNVLARRIETRGKLNILDLHLHSEPFYQHFFNLLFGWNLRNLNTVKQNVEAIDLIDESEKIIIQVSATATVQKVGSALTKDLLSAYSCYRFKFISISKSADELRKKTFKNPHNLLFSPATDIYDIVSILREVNALQIDPLNEIFEFIKKELGEEISPQKVETNLAAIINILAKENLNYEQQKITTYPYDVEKKIDINQLVAVRDIIDEYKIHYGRLDRIYSVFDSQGSNKSLSVFNVIRRQYVNNVDKLSDDKLFLAVLDGVIEVIQSSKNFESLPFDELELCASILVVDAFIRCKIFKNPEEASNAPS